ncbi:MAG: MBL fold metallo-hydrolase [Actinomycetota bacterium]|nr:MBL fold metallo-hydrolase [Actinomycetota bacterium]
MKGSPVAAAEPRAAATLVIARDTREGLEILLTRRSSALRFMGGAMVFPGGALGSADLARAAEETGLDPAATAARMGEDDPETAVALHVCALREAAEEVGLVDVVPADLVFGGRWVTPLGAPIRFDTRFFLVRAPTSWEPVPDPSEVEELRWTTPSAALTDVASGAVAMAPPTIEMLQHLDEYHDVDHALDAFRTHDVIGSGEILSMRLSPLVQVVLAPNPGVMTGPGTNTYIVGTTPTFVIDPAVEDAAYLDALLTVAGSVAAVLITHRHPDHVGGVRAVVDRTGAPVRAFGNADARGVAVEPLSDGEILEVPGARLETIHAPGHASDHVCFLLHGAATLIAGDNVLGEGTAVIAPPDGNMADYLATLERLRRLPIDRIYPGHFRPLDGGVAVIDDYIAHRRKREALILAAIEDPATTEDIVARAYLDTPEHLHSVAAYSAIAHLEMLESEGRVSKRGDKWVRTGVY